MTPRRPGAFLVAALLAAAVGCFVASLLVGPSRGPLELQGRNGPVSAPPGRQAAVALPSWLGGAPASGSMSVSFSFADAHPQPGALVVRGGTDAAGLEVRLEGPIEGEWYATLRLTPWPGGPLRAVLVPHLRPGRRYAVRVSLLDAQRVRAYVDGHEVVAFRAPIPTVDTLFNPLVAGDRAAARRLRPGGRPALAGARAPAVTGLTLAYRAYAGVGSATAVLALRTIAAMAAMGALLVALVGLVSAGASALPGSLRRRYGRIRALAGRRIGLVGLVLLVAGGAVLELVTPPGDVVGVASGYEHLAVAGVPPGGHTAYWLEPAPSLGGAGASVDATVRFELRMDRRPRLAGTPVVTTALHGSGIAISANPDGSLVGAIRTSAVQGGTFLVARRVPLGRYTSVQIRVVRSREVEALVGGVQTFAYTYTAPIWQAAPTGLVVGSAHAALALRQVSATAVLYAPPEPATPILLVRLAQLAGFLLVAAGALAVASRLLSRLVPKERPSRPLVRAVFGVAAAGVLVNLLVDALHLQHSPAPYAPRNTWLFASDARFSDFLQVFELLRGLHPYGASAGSYPPVGYFLVGPFAPMSQFAALLCFLAVFVGVFAWWLWRSFSGGGRIEALAVIVVAFASYPVTFALDRANVDLLVALLLVVAVAALEQRRDWLASSLIGLSAAAKIFPGLYVLLFLRPLRRRRFAVVAAMVALVATLLCFVGLAGSLGANVAGLRRGLGVVQEIYGNGVSSTIDSVTLSSWLQAIGYAIGGAPGAQAVGAVSRAGLPVEELFGALALGLYLWRREREPWRAVTLATVAVLLLPQVSFAYDLLYLFVPLALFVRKAEPGRRSLRIAALFGLLLAPKAYLYFGSSFIDSGTLFNAPLLVALAAAVVHDGWAERRQALRKTSVAGSAEPAILYSGRSS